MSDQDVTALALRFYLLHNIAELRKIQAAHPDLAISDNELYQLAYGEHHPRTTKRHEDSEGESENDDPTIAHRSLRLDEDSPELLGLSAPVGHNPYTTARAHINSGSRATTKSRFISASRSIKKAGAWASTNTVDEKVGRVASFDIPYGTSSGDVAPVDVTLSDVQDKLFPNGGSGLNSAKASQEVLVPDRVPPEYIRSIYVAMPLSPGAYKRKKASGARHGSKLLRARSKVSEVPQAFELIETYNREQSSARRLSAARMHWNDAIADMVEQTNAQFVDEPGFQSVDEDDLAEFLVEHVEDPQELDYISSDRELEQYLADIDQAIRTFADFCKN
jgi:hypothetical protein